MGKGLNRERRRQKQQRENIPNAVFIEPIKERPIENKYEAAPSTLRLVRPENGNIQGEPSAAGRSGETVVSVQQPERSNGVGGTEAGGHYVDTGADDGTDNVPNIVRLFDAEEINKVYNDPSVFPLLTIPGTGPLDATPLVLDQRNVLLMADGGGVLFVWQEPGVYEAHNAFIESRRGKYAVKATLAACRWMFTHTDCMELLTRVPDNNPAATGLCKLIGATKEFERKGIWQTENEMVGIGFWSLRYDDWVRKTITLKNIGQQFHQRLEQEYIRLGHPEPLHADEDCHDLHVGACYEMILSGQIDKAIVLYNRWARFAGYAQIALIAHNPIVIDIVESLLQVTDDNIKVILVRK